MTPVTTNIERQGITEFNKLLTPCRTHSEGSQNIYWNYIGNVTELICRNPKDTCMRQKN